MNRKNPGTPPAVNMNEKPGWVTETRKYKIITPLYGGGEETQKADSVTVVRATEVRGHLRFWWRATRGGMFNGDLAEMKKREETIWGSSAEKGKPGPSDVSVCIIDRTHGKPKNEQKKGDRTLHIAQPGADWSYVAFPLRESRGSVLEEVSFELEIKYSAKIKTEVEAALWAWETFGGIGARTRRGFGVLQNTNLDAPSKQEIEEVINVGLKKHVSDGIWPDGVPHLKRELNFLVKPNSTPKSAWENLFQRLKAFRQEFRDPGSTSRYGRSKWPEPDSIRLILNKAGVYTFGRHKPKHTVQEKFPRAKFGLPINFEFPKKEDGDPNKTTLQGVSLDNDKYIDRLASPLIIRPLACKDGAVGLAAILEWEPVESGERYTPPGGLLLINKGYGEFQVESDLDMSDAKNIEPLNLAGKPQPDVLQAFLDFLK